MEKTQILYLLVEVIIFCIPVATLIWKAGKQSRMIDEHSLRIEKLERLTGEDLTSMRGDIIEIKTSVKYIEQELQEVKK